MGSCEVRLEGGIVPGEVKPGDRFYLCAFEGQPYRTGMLEVLSVEGDVVRFPWTLNCGVPTACPGDVVYAETPPPTKLQVLMTDVASLREEVATLRWEVDELRGKGRCP